MDKRGEYGTYYSLIQPKGREASRMEHDGKRRNRDVHSNTSIRRDWIPDETVRFPKQYMLLAGKPVIMHTLER